MRRLLRLAPLILVPVLVAAGCGGDDDDDTGDGPDGQTPNANGNQILNGDFENGRLPWYSLRPPDWLESTDRFHGGSTSAHLQMRDTAASEEDKIYYLVQEIEPSELPEVLSGEYFVENWVPGTKSQYLQFVVIIWADDVAALPTCPPTNEAPNGAPCPNYQIRYLLAGINEDPFQISNAKFVYVSSDPPVQGEWVHFERNVKEDFQMFWGGVPKNVTKIRLLFEVRYDNKAPGEGPLEADVYYDDLYFGPAASKP